MDSSNGTEYGMFLTDLKCLGGSLGLGPDLQILVRETRERFMYSKRGMRKKETHTLYIFYLELTAIGDGDLLHSSARLGTNSLNSLDNV